MRHCGHGGNGRYTAGWDVLGLVSLFFRRDLVSDNPFSKPLASGLSSGELDQHARLMIPNRLQVTERALRPSLTLLLWSNLTWAIFLLFVLGVTVFEATTGESVSLIGGVVATIVGWTNVIFPYNIPLGLLNLILTVTALVGVVNGLRRQNLLLTRLAGHLSYLPLLGAWLGLGGPIGIVVLAKLRRRGVAKNFDIG